MFIKAACTVGRQNKLPALPCARYTLVITIFLNERAQTLLEQLNNVMKAKNYSPRSITNYTREMRLLFLYYNDVNPKTMVTNGIGQINFYTH